VSVRPACKGERADASSSVDQRAEILSVARLLGSIQLAMTGSATFVASATPLSAVEAGSFGLYRAQDFVLTDGAHAGRDTIASARWYFDQETIAVPKPGIAAAGYARGMATFDDVRAWNSARPIEPSPEYPPLVWVAAPQIVRHGRLRDDGATLGVGETTIPIARTAKIPLNRSYYDASSTRFFDGRPLTARGHLDSDGRFAVRTLWPEDFRVPDAPPMRALPMDKGRGAALRELMREEPGGGARSPFAASTLWRRPSTSANWRGRAVVAFIVNGAQGDDDEAHAGHFGVLTGRVAEDGDIGDWLVNNFYTLDSESEKGIIAAPVPLDNYLADLNSGQAYYRPSYLLVAVLAQDRAATLTQSAFGRVYNQFYRRQLVYYHPTTNCTSISIDTLRALDLDVPARGPTGRALAWAGFPFVAAKERSIEKAKQAFDYLTVDQTRLMPAVAIEDIFECLVSLCRRTDKHVSPDRSLGHMLSQDIDALVFLRIPQIPSSRAWGDAPVLDIREYRARLPRDRSKMQIVPVPARPFPDALRDADLQPPPAHPSRFAAIVWATLLLFAGSALIILLAVLLTGCATNEASTKPSLPPITPIMVPPAMASGDAPALSGRVWRWQSTELRGERIVPDSPERYTVEFQPDGRVQLRADCNRGGAGYTARADRSLSITPAATTKMGCPPGSKGTEFVRQLADVDRYDFVDGNLVLTLKSNAGAMRFAPAIKETPK